MPAEWEVAAGKLNCADELPKSVTLIPPLVKVTLEYSF